MSFLHKVRQELEIKSFPKKVELKNLTRPLSLVQFIKSKNGIIGEFKRATPVCKFKLSLSPAEVSLAYQKANFSAVSVVVDENYFLTGEKDLMEIRRAVSLPVLKKGFFIHPHEVVEARNAGADSILLIAGLLGGERLSLMLEVCRRLEMEPVVEVSSVIEVDEIAGLPIKVVGVNNRNLHDLSVDLRRGQKVLEQVLQRKIGEVRIVESGLKTPSDIRFFKQNGADGFLIGSIFMEAEDLDSTIKYLLGGLSA